MNTPTFRILALDGGGIKGTFTASILAAWEEETGLRIVDHFDLIAGTSTGGILALGLGLGIPAAKLLKFYTEHGPQIFPNTGGPRQLRLMLAHLWRPKYSQAPLREALSHEFQEKLLGDSTCRLLIPTYDAIRGRIFFMKTAHHPRFKYDYQAKAVEVALATSAAPTFFKPAEFEKHEGNTYIDGGVSANCPALAAVLEAHHFLNIPLPSIRVLSVGTTHESPALLHRLNRTLRWLPLGALRWAPHLLGVLFQAQMETSLVAARLLAGQVLRVDLETPEGAYKMDSTAKIRELAALGRGRAVEKEILEAVQKDFLNGVKVEPFVPIFRP